MTSRYPILAKYMRTQACLAQPNHLCDKTSELERTLKARNLITIDPITSLIEKRTPNDIGEAVYYAIQIHGCRGDHPTPDKLQAIENEISEAFENAGITGHPIACEWRGDHWADREIERFDETVGHGAGEFQATRIHEQKFRRTEGEALLTYRIPAGEIDNLAHAMRAIQAATWAAKEADLKNGIS